MVEEKKEREGDDEVEVAIDGVLVSGKEKGERKRRG